MLTLTPGSLRHWRDARCCGAAAAAVSTRNFCISVLLPLVSFLRAQCSEIENHPCLIFNELLTKNCLDIRLQWGIGDVSLSK